jgi:hypothetical protein
LRIRYGSASSRLRGDGNGEVSEPGELEPWRQAEALIREAVLTARLNQLSVLRLEEDAEGLVARFQKLAGLIDGITSDQKTHVVIYNLASFVTAALSIWSIETDEEIDLLVDRVVRQRRAAVGLE